MRGKISNIIFFCSARQPWKTWQNWTSTKKPWKRNWGSWRRNRWNFPSFVLKKRNSLWHIWFYSVQFPRNSVKFHLPTWKSNCEAEQRQKSKTVDWKEDLAALSPKPFVIGRRTHSRDATYTSRQYRNIGRWIINNNAPELNTPLHTWLLPPSTSLARQAFVCAACLHTRRVLPR